MSTSRNTQVCKSDSEEICFGRKFFGVKEEIFEASRLLLLEKWNIKRISTIAPLLIMPSSPRLSLIRGRENEAKNTLESFSETCGNNISFEEIRLVYKARVQSYRQQLKDFKIFPARLKRQQFAFNSVDFHGFPWLRFLVGVGAVLFPSYTQNIPWQLCSMPSFLSLLFRHARTSAGGSPSSASSCAGLCLILSPYPTWKSP